MSRLNQTINTPIVLNYTFYQNSDIISPTSFIKVELYKISSTGANTLVETLTNPTPSIVESTPGVFQYTFTAVTTSGLYFDKIYIQPTPTSGIFTDSIRFQIRDVPLEFSGTPATNLHPTCRVYGTIIKPDGQPMIGARVAANLTVFPSRINSTEFSMTQTRFLTFTNELGYFYLDLVRSVNYRILIKDILYDNYVTIPATDKVLLWSIGSVQEIGDATTNDVTSGQAAW